MVNMVIIITLIILYFMGIGFLLGCVCEQENGKDNLTQFEQIIVAIFIPIVVLIWLFYSLKKEIFGD